MYLEDLGHVILQAGFVTSINSKTGVHSRLSLLPGEYQHTGFIHEDNTSYSRILVVSSLSSSGIVRTEHLTGHLLIMTIQGHLYFEEKVRKKSA